MTDIAIAWNLQKDIETAKKLVTHGSGVLQEWYGEENYKRLLEEYLEGGHETADKWVKDSFIDAMDDIVSLLQIITNETQNNPIVQRKLKAVGFIPSNNL